MSIHATKLETEAIILKQRRVSLVTSLIIGLLSVVLLMLISSFFLLAPLFKETPTFVTYESNLKDNTELEVKKVTTSMDRKPSSPSSSMASVIAAKTDSPKAVPVPDVEVTVPSFEFGSGDDFGEGWENGKGSGTGGGGASFFEQKVTAERIAYVIDYSLSMSGARENLMRNELKKSVSGLPDGMNYQMIFFAGPHGWQETRSPWARTENPRLSNTTVGISIAGSTHQNRRIEIFTGVTFCPGTIFVHV